MDQSTTKKVSLPKGWIVKASRSQEGKEYFCNPSKKIALWSLAEVFAFERGLRQLENTSPSKKFKPVSSSADPEAKAVAGGSGTQTAPADTSSKESCLRPREKPFRMVLKTTGKSSQANSTLGDCIAEATAFCSYSSSTPGKRSSDASSQSPRGKGVFEKQKAATSSPAGKRLKPLEGVASGKHSSSSAEEEANSGRTKQSGSGKKKGAIEINQSQLGSSASKLWDKLYPRQIKKSPIKKMNEKPSGLANTGEDDLKEKLVALKAKIDARNNLNRNLSNQSGSSSSKSPTVSIAPTPSAVGKKRISPTSPPSTEERKAEPAGMPHVAATQKPRRGVQCSRERPHAGVRLEDIKLPATAASPSTSVKSTGLGRARKVKTSATASAGPQLYDRTSPSGASTAGKQSIPSVSAYLHLTALKPFTIPKRPPAATAPPPLPTLPCPEPPPPPPPPPLPCPAPLSPLPPHCLEPPPPPLPCPELLPPHCLTLPPPPPPPCPAPLTAPSSQCEAAVPVAVVPPFGLPADAWVTLPASSASSPAGAAEARCWADGPAPADRYQQPAVAMTLGSEAALPKEAEEDEQELMELDEPELNGEEVLSQIACLRGAGGSVIGSDVPWGHDAAAAAAAHAGGEAAALLAGWSPQPQPAVPAAAESAPPRSLTVVLDTNVLIHGVGFVLDVRDSFIEGLRPQLLIPWVVVQELDGLKQGGRQKAGHDTTVSTKARAAITFLLECFQARHPGVRGQTTAEAAAARGQLERRVADDAILECCLATGRQGDVLLLSDDKNLLTKVLLHGLSGVSRQQLLQTTDLCGISENVPVTEENQVCFTKIILRKVLSYVIRREMALAYGAAWHALPGVRRPWWSLRDLVSVVLGHRTVFRTVFADRWSHWQQVLKLATRPVLSAVEQSSLAAGVAALLPLLQPAAHYLPRLRPLAAALQAGAAPPAAVMAALGPCFGGPAGRLGPAAAQSEGGQTGGPDGDEPAASLAAMVSQRGREAARALNRSQPTAPSRRQNVRATPETAQRSRDYGLPAAESAPPEDADRSGAGTPPPPDDDTVMGSEGGPGELLDPSAVLDLFQSVWSYVQTCCGVLLDAAGVPHPYQYERPAVPPSPDECAVFLPELGTAVQTLSTTLKRLMGVSVVALASDATCLEAACDSLRVLVSLAGHETVLAPQQLLRFLKSPANRLLLGKGQEQLSGFLTTLEELHTMVS